jgi:inhibitor of cysteine peptidase
MRRTMIVVLVAVLSVAAVATLGAGCGSSAQAAAKEITAKDNGAAVTAKVGDKLDVVLESNPTTGFEWEKESGDAAVVKMLGEPVYSPTPTSTQVVGSGGTTTFHFEAAAAGSTTVKLIYHRTFEKDVPPVQTFEVTVTVQ